MPIGDLSNKVSKEDVDKVQRIKNPPEYEAGFEPGSQNSGLDDIQFDDLFGGDFGNVNTSTIDQGQSTSLSNIFSTHSLSQPQRAIFGSPQQSIFGNQNQPYQQFPFGKTVPKEDALDKVIEHSEKALVSAGYLMVEMVKSMRNRNADDFAYYSRNLIVTGAVVGVANVGLGLLGFITGIKFLSFSGLPLQLIGASILTLGTGLVGLGGSALKAVGATPDKLGTINDLKDIAELDSEDSIDDYEDNLDSILDDLMNNDNSDPTYNSNYNNSYRNTYSDIDNEISKEIDYNKKLDAIRENKFINRAVLVDTFKEFFPLSTPNFADKKEIPNGSQEFQTLETICLKVLSNVARLNMEDINSNLESAYETYFSYELRLKRVRGVTKLDDIAREMEAYFRESSADTSVVATVDIEGDFYKVRVTKGVTAVVTLGDVFRQDYVTKFFSDTKNKLPIVLGISELGEVLVDDAKIYDTMMIAGKPRSGKSWYVLSILMSLMVFNTPEEVQFIIVDPKESNLFKTLALMPHVAGLHSDKNILEILRDVIENEGARRKKLLADNKCDDIWALWKKGIKIPVLYLVIDEVITIKNNLGALDKEFDALMQTIMSQLPSQGIRIMFVPHRATGIINKTNRTMVSFSAAIRSNIEDIKDTLDISKWSRALVNPGDVALKTSSRENALYVRGAAITTSDEDNTELIINVAKAFYKMGVDIPDMSSLSVSVNRDEDYIRDELYSDWTNRIQYNATNVFDD